MRSLSPSKDRMLSAHVAEYSALTTRCTYWILIQSSLWPMLAIILTLVNQIKNVDGRSLAWISVLLILVVIATYYLAVIEQYRTILYIETELRNSVRSIVNDGAFWSYEGWLARQRRPGLMAGEWTPLILPVAVFGVVIWKRWPTWSTSDTLFLILGVAVLGADAAWAVNAARIRQQFATAVQKTLRR